MKHLTAVFAIAAVCLALPVSATVVADYRFEDNLSSSVPGAPDLNPLGAGGFVDTTVDATTVRGWAFPAQTGLDLDVTGLVGSDVYTVVMLFEAQEVVSYAKLLDTQNRVNDIGLYYVGNDLVFYGGAGGTTDGIMAGMYYQVVVTRDALGDYVGYVDGVQQFTFNDSSNYATITTNRLVFFRDDTSTGDGENTAGTVVRIRIYDHAMTPPEVTALDRLPAPLILADIPVLNSVGVLTLISIMAVVAIVILRRQS